jgi:hypothetical protein
MSAPYSTLLLDVDTWDIVFDASGNLAVAAPPYAVAQDVASAIRTFKGEVYYDTSLGVDYGQILGKQPPLSRVLADMQNAALSVPSVANAVATIQNFNNDTRAVVGQVMFTDTAGNVQIVGA